MKAKITNYYFFVLISGLLSIIYCIVFKPLTFESQGDAPSYIDLAKQIFNFPDAPARDLSFRSPLYSILLGSFMVIFGQNNFVLPTFIFQFFLLFLVSLLVYKTFLLITDNKKIAFFAGIISSLNLSAIFYAYNIVSEILTIFLFSCMVYQMLIYLKEKHLKNLFAASVFSALLVLARFNTIGQPFVLILIVVLFNISLINKAGFLIFLKHLFLVALPIAIIFNSWALYNYVNNGFFNVIPTHHTEQRWTIPTTINDKNTVSERYNKVLEIFLKNIEKQKQVKKGLVKKKGSLLENKFIADMYAFFNPGINGYELYLSSEPELLEYYNYPNTPEGIYQLGKNLVPFYKEIASQNQKQLFKLRIYSFLYTFKSNSPIIQGKANLNLNKLPSPIIYLYKMGLIFAIIFVYILSVIHFFSIVRKKQIQSKIAWVALYAVLWYFPAINFYANVLSDAGRFKFPAESVILGLFVYYLSIIIARFKDKFKNKQAI